MYKKKEYVRPLQSHSVENIEAMMFVGSTSFLSWEKRSVSAR